MLWEDTSWGMEKLNHCLKNEWRGEIKTCYWDWWSSGCPTEGLTPPLRRPHCRHDLNTLSEKKLKKRRIIHSFIKFHHKQYLPRDPSFIRFESVFYFMDWLWHCLTGTFHLSYSRKARKQRKTESIVIKRKSVIK